MAPKKDVLQSVFDESTSSPSIKLAILDQLKEQQNDRFMILTNTEFSQSYKPLLLLVLRFIDKIFLQNL